ncbi:MAG: GlsB/YeaQ/YmgE family stress response membrane protein [Chloroflexi bacterium]|nr:MAG: GlsB/YeaQ/YmgE family stress response membrane protein [Chloroflexota bacterium]
MDLGSIIGFIIVGAIVGVIARFLVPGPDPMGWVGTILLGIVGSFVGGFLLNLLSGSATISPAGWIGSIVGAIIVLLIWRQMGGRRAAT